jgi:hypothetical protein
VFPPIRSPLSEKVFFSGGTMWSLSGHEFLGYLIKTPQINKIDASVYASVVV